MTDLSTLEARKAIAQKYAAKHLLDPAIVAAVCEQESAWQAGEVRFEPAFLERYIVPLGLGDMEAFNRSTSWGLMQIMGQVAIEHGFGDADLTTLRDSEVGIEYGCRKLRRCFDAHSEPETALQFYNGGGNPNYASQVMARMAKYL